MVIGFVQNTNTIKCLVCNVPVQDLRSLKIRYFTTANDRFQNNPNAGTGHYRQTLHNCAVSDKPLFINEHNHLPNYCKALFLTPSATGQLSIYDYLMWVFYIRFICLYCVQQSNLTDLKDMRNSPLA